MRTEEQIREEIKRLDNEAKEYEELGCWVQASTASEKAEILEWVLQVGEEG